MFKSAQTLSLLVLISVILLMAPSGALAQKPLCIVALLKYQDEYHDFINHLELGLGQNIEAIKEKADIILDQPQGIKNCLEAGYKSVVIVAHSTIIENPTSVSRSFSSMLYYKTQGDIRQGLLYPDQVFQNTKISKTIQDFGIASCHSELLIKNYPYLFELFKKQRIPIQFAEADMVEDHKKIDLRYRSFDSAVNLIQRFYPSP